MFHWQPSSVLQAGSFCSQRHCMSPNSPKIYLTYCYCLLNLFISKFTQRIALSLILWKHWNPVFIELFSLDAFSYPSKSCSSLSAYNQCLPLFENFYLFYLLLSFCLRQIVFTLVLVFTAFWFCLCVKRECVWFSPLWDIFFQHDSLAS